MFRSGYGSFLDVERIRDDLGWNRGVIPVLQETVSRRSIPLIAALASTALRVVDTPTPQPAFVKEKPVSEIA